MTQNEEAILSIDTLMHYGLKQQPFAANSPDAYIYSDPALDMPVNAIINYLLTEEHVIVLKGEYGIGKSTHINKLLSKARGSLNTCLFHATISSSLAEIEHCLHNCWGQDATPQELLQAIRQVLQQGGRLALIIDDAHDLDADVLEQLLQLRQAIREEYGRSFGLVLVAESSIENTLSNLEADVPEISQAHSLMLRPLTREQTAAYIDHRLRIAGLFMNNPFTDEDIALLIQEGHGLPGRINPLATQQLEKYGQNLIRQEQSRRPGWLHHHRTAVIAVALILIVTGTLIAVLQGFFSADEPEEEKEFERITLTTPEPEPEPKPQELLPEPEPSEEIVIPPEETTVSALVEEPTTQEPPPKAIPAVSTPEPVIQPQPEQEIAPAPAVEPPEQPPESVKPPAKATPIVSAKTDAAPKGLQDQKWLLAQKPDRFAIQLLASSSMQSVEDFAQGLKLDTTLAYYERKINDKILYVLVAASYKDRQAAEKAVAGFPASLKRNNPWIRPLKDIQDSIYAQ
jgi:DamX protein